MRRLKSSKNRSTDSRLTAGFSLIELLVVIAVILIITAIAIPNFINSRMRANESSAAQNLRNISTAQIVYSTTYGIGFSTSLLHLSGDGVTVDQDEAGLIDQALGSGTKSGYIITYLPLTVDPQGRVQTYSVYADPKVAGSTGQKHFYTDQTCVIRYNLTTTAGPSDSPLS